MAGNTRIEILTSVFSGCNLTLEKKMVTPTSVFASRYVSCDSRRWRRSIWGIHYWRGRVCLKRRDGGVFKLASSTARFADLCPSWQARRHCRAHANVTACLEVPSLVFT